MGQRIFVIRSCLFVLLLWPILMLAAPVQIDDIRLASHLHAWRLVFDATGPVEYRRFQLQNPSRVIYDISNAELLRPVQQSLLLGTPIKAIRTAKRSHHTLRIVLELSRNVQITDFVLNPEQAHNDYRLVVDLTTQRLAVTAFNWPNKKSAVMAAPHVSKAAIAHRKHKPKHKLKHKRKSKLRHHRVRRAPTRRIPEPYIPEKKKRRYDDIIVVVDPGHGGKDPGTTGPNGVHEKTVVLAISKDLVKLINAQPGFKAVLTRHGDYYLYLRQRLRIARRDHADMFVAIHADAYANRHAAGASVFALSSRGATSEAARWIAARENKSELIGGVNLSDKSNLLRSVLINLSQTATIRTSLQIGQDMIHFLRGVTRLHHSHVEQAAFVVLKSPDIPSLLVESGFLSNPHEERKLGNPRYRYRLALAIMKGIKDYFVHHPPRGTWLARHHRQPLYYRVTRGDSLSMIASRFGTTMAVLKRQNRLRSSHIRIGQQLLIPTS